MQNHDLFVAASKKVHFSCDTKKKSWTFYKHHIITVGSAYKHIYWVLEIVNI